MHACVYFCACVCVEYVTYTLNEWSRNGTPAPGVITGL